MSSYTSTLSHDKTANRFTKELTFVYIFECCCMLYKNNFMPANKIWLTSTYDFSTEIDKMANRFSVIITGMKKKTYDFLDQRKQEFDADFDEFKRMVAELHVCIYLLCPF